MNLNAPVFFDGPQDVAALRLQLNTIILYLQALEGVTDVGPYLVIAKNLSDLADAAAARLNLGLGSAAVEDTSAFDPAGAAAAAQAASDPAGSAAAVQALSLQKSANLSDVASAATARGNLGAAKSGVNTDISSLNNLSVQGVTANYPVAASDSFIEVDATAGPVTVTFIPTGLPGKQVKIVKVDTSSNQVSISDGTSVLAVLIQQYQALAPYSNGTVLRIPLTLA